MTKILYTADLHGNVVQYDKLVSYAIKAKTDVIVIGGDITPKDRTRESFIERQKEFLDEILPNIFRRFKSERPNSKVFLMMGNDDCACNLKILEKYPSLYTNIHNKRISLQNEYNIVGYSNIPITPFSIKDWEKFDFSKIPDKDKNSYDARKNSNYELSGIKSTASGFVDFLFHPSDESTDSIQKDLERIEIRENPDKTVYVMHCPPNDTSLDMIAQGTHVGSYAIREFIEKYSPYLTLHGHIHETVEISGNYKQKIGRTLLASAGNHNIGDKLCIIEFALENLSSIERKII